MDLDVSDNRFAQNSDAQPSRITATGRQEGLGRGRGVEGVPRPRPGQHVKSGCGVAHRAGQHPTADQPGTVDPVRTGRNSPTAGFEADDTATWRRDAYRPAAVGALSDRHLTSPDCGRSTTRGPSRHSGVVPRSDGRRPTIRLGVTRKPKLGSGRRTDRDGTGGLEPSDDAVVVVRRRPADSSATDGSGRPG